MKTSHECAVGSVARVLLLGEQIEKAGDRIHDAAKGDKD